MSSLDQKQIILTIVQGADGKEWAAEKNGWSRDSTVPRKSWQFCHNNSGCCILILDDTSISLLLAVVLISLL